MAPVARQLVLLVTAVTAVLSCSVPSPQLRRDPASELEGRMTGAPGSVSGPAAEAARLLADGTVTVRGAVHWPGNRSVQAVPGAVVIQSTISLIDQNTGVTVASGLTDNTGNFALSTGAFVPAAGSHYILEASKGLNAQLPGNAAVRMRTILRWSGSGWLSITNAAVGGAINIHQLTTAIALEVGLGRIPATNTIDTVDNSNPPGLKVGTIGGVAGTELLNLAADVRNYITADLDPVVETTAIAPVVASFSPGSGAVGTVVSITGSGYVSTPGATTVKFNGTAASILAMSSKAIHVAVPSGASTGPVSIATVRGGAVNSASNFTVSVPPPVAVAVRGLGGPPIAGRPLTLLGQGFVPGGNTVTFAKQGGGNVNASTFPDQGDSTAFTVDVPKTAASGFLTVTNSTGTSTKVYLTFQVAGPGITEVFPNKGVAWGDVQLYGENFGGARGTVSVDGFAAFVQVWSDKYIRFKVPYQVTAGARQITVESSLGLTGSTTWTALDGVVAHGSFQRVGTLPMGGVNLIPYFSGKNIYFAGGAGSNRISRLSLNTDGGPGSIVNDVATLPFGSAGQDMTGDFQNWVGNTVWHFGNNGTTDKAVLTFDMANGDLTRVDRAAANWNTWPDGNSAVFNETGTTTGPRGLYAGGSYSAGANCRTYYARWDGLNASSLTGWNGYIANPANPGCSADAVLLVLNDRLWWLSIYSQAFSPLQPDGTPTGWQNTGPPVTNYYFANFTPAGKYIWTFGKWCGGSEVSRTTIVNGNTPAQNTATWDRLSDANVAFGGAGNQVVVGGWMYFVGGACGNDNVIHAAPITQ